MHQGLYMSRFNKLILIESIYYYFFIHAIINQHTIKRRKIDIVQSLKLNHNIHTFRKN